MKITFRLLHHKSYVYFQNSYSQEESVVRSVIGDSLYTVIHTKTGVEPGMSHHYYEIMRADTSSAATVEYYKQLVIQYHERFEHIND